MRRFLLTILGLVFAFGFAVAQKSVSGKVTDSDGAGLPGVNVVVKGTTSGTVTDVDGNFKLDIAGDDAVLVFSFIGFQTQEIAVGSQTTFNIPMASEATQLGEVVVTALGITQEKAALGYGVTTISEDLVRAKPEADIAKLLRGKAPGVNIMQSDGLAGTGSSILIRGLSSISGSNQPLFVVDGVPFNSETNNDRTATTGGQTASSRFLDLDPNNIAEISILKGLSATVLYGELGRNGVILVTTKTGSGSRSAKKTEISFDQNFTWSQVANIPDYQDSYGNGFSGNFGWFFSNWGPSFDTRGSNGIDANGQVDHPYDQGQYAEDFPEFQGVRYDYKPYPSVENVFQTGVQSNTSINISRNLADNSNVSFSYSNLTDNGVIPNDKNKYVKNNFSIGGGTKLENGLTINTSLNFVQSNALKPTAGNSFGSGPSDGVASFFGDIFYTPRSIDLLNLPFQSPVDGSMVYYRRGASIQNPLWTLNNASDEEDVLRSFGRVALNYEVNDWLTAAYQFGFDNTNTTTVRRVNKGGSQIPDGEMRTNNWNTLWIDHLFNLSVSTDISQDFSFDAILGSNFRKIDRKLSQTYSFEQFVYGLFAHDNFKQHRNDGFIEEENNIGAYATATLGYRDWAYLNFQGRNDWTSTLEKENRSIFYPSVSASVILSDAIPGLSGSAVDFMKLRLGYGTSAGYPDPYQTRNILSSATAQFITRGGTSLDVNSVDTRLGNSNLTPELHTEIELGLEMAFLRNRVSFDLSLYDKNSNDLIIDLDLDPATGFTNTTVNAAEVNNKGIELAATFVPLRTSDWNIDLTINYTKNVNKVIGIFPGVDQVQIGATSGGVGNWAIPGEEYGVIQGLPFETDPNGNIVINNADGIPITAGDIQVIGNPNANYLASLYGTIAWKGLSLYFLIDYKDGGDISSVLTATMLARGNTVDTDVDRFLPVIFPGVNKQPDGTFTPNTTQVYLGDIAFRAYFFAEEGQIFDGTVIRLRETTLSYELPSSLLDSTPFGSVSIRVVGQNLFYNAPNFPKGVNYDPEITSTGVSNSQGLEYMSGPTTKKYGVGLSLTF